MLGPFKDGYWTNPAYLLPPEADLLAVTHYQEALDLQKGIMKIRTIFGAVGAVNMGRLNLIFSIIGRTHSQGLDESAVAAYWSHGRLRQS